MRTLTLLSLPLLLSACGDKDEQPATQDTQDTQDTGGHGVVGEDDTPYLGEVDEDELASFDAEAVEAAVAEVIALARTLHAAPALAAYYDVAQHMSGDCPA